MKRAIAAIGLLLAVLTPCSAQDAPGEQFTHPLGFALITTTVDDVQRILGPAPVTEEGHHERIVCYVWPDSKAVVTFMSQEERLYGRFTMRKYNGERPVGCPTILPSAIKEKQLIVGGLGLGMSLSEFRNVLGKLETLEDGSIGAIFEYSTAIDRTEKPYAIGDTLYTTIVVSGRFKEGGLIKLEIFKSSST